MKAEERKERILALLEEHQAEPLTAAELGGKLGLRGKNLKQLQKWLHELVLEGAIVRIRQNRFGLGEPADLVTGRLRVMRGGNGFVTSRQGAKGVFVPESAMSTALPGDTVMVRLVTAADTGRSEGQVVRIVERGRRDIVGTLKTTGRFYYVAPLNPVYRQDIYVPDPGGAKLGDRVVVRFADWVDRHVNPEGEIVDVIGPSENPSLDTLAIMKHYGFEEEFPARVLRDAETVAARLDRPGRRLDLRERFIMTIDPVRARDFDDALSLETDADGNRVLGVHIADVSHFVTPGSAIDREASRRGTSVYFPDRVVPMLPEQLSNGVCSLVPNQDRLTFSVFLTVDASGTVIKRSAAKSVIHSSLRLTYEQAMALMQGEQPDLAAFDAVAQGRLPQATALLRQLDRLAQQFRKARFARHALDLDVPEVEIVMDATGMMTGIRRTVNDASHQLVEECMVAANEAIATELSNRGWKYLARLHEPPAPEKIEELTVELLRMGYKPGNLKQARHLAAFLRAVAADPLGHHARVAVLRSLKRAVYSAEASGHFGLAKAFYAHFTSPIRRYPDLVAHRLLAQMLAGETTPLYPKNELDTLALWCSETEQQAEEAERDVEEIKKYRFLEQQLKQRVPPVYEAVVTNVANFGMFVEALDLMLQGLVKVSTLSDRFVRFNRETRTLHDGNRVFKQGQRVQVKPVSVDFDNRRVDFVLVQ